MRSGHFVKQASGYRAFIPAPLPPEPPIQMDSEIVALLSQADLALGRLDGATLILPNPNLFVAMFVRQEAVLSSQIEGTQSTLEDVLVFEIDEAGEEQPKDIEEVVNYVRAINFGLEHLEQLPMSLRLIREIHSELLMGGRGGHLTPGEFRRSQNWIGPAGSTLTNATFIPPPVPEMHEALGNLESFLHQSTYPVLIQCGLAHAQFETIHPFLDGNGRVGRLLITFMLCERQVLTRPLLYLSYYFKLHRMEYYDRLSAVRTQGDWEGWLKFFLRGVLEVSHEAVDRAKAILELREAHRQILITHLDHQASRALQLLEVLFTQPIVTVRLVEKAIQCSYVTANKIIKQFEEVGLLQKNNGAQRNRRFRYDAYLRLFEAE
jgi:Fic family protein